MRDRSVGTDAHINQQVAEENLPHIVLTFEQALFHRVCADHIGHKRIHGDVS